MNHAPRTGPPPLLQAAADLRHLLERGYPRQRVLELCGDRWDLDGSQREKLRRGVQPGPLAAQRRAKLLTADRVAGRELGVDGHNVLITLETALKGLPLLACDDSLVRDTALVGRNHRSGPETEAAISQLTAALAALEPSGVSIWLSAPLPRSGELAARLGLALESAGLGGRALAVDAVWRHLAAHGGPVASSDGKVIDQAAEAFDLAGHIIAAMRPAPVLEKLQQ